MTEEVRNNQQELALLDDAINIAEKEELSLNNQYLKDCVSYLEDEMKNGRKYFVISLPSKILVVKAGLPNWDDYDDKFTLPYIGYSFHQVGDEKSFIISYCTIGGEFCSSDFTGEDSMVIYPADSTIYKWVRSFKESLIDNDYISLSELTDKIISECKKIGDGTSLIRENYLVKWKVASENYKSLMDKFCDMEDAVNKAEKDKKVQEFLAKEPVGKYYYSHYSYLNADYIIFGRIREITSGVFSSCLMKLENFLKVKKIGDVVDTVLYQREVLKPPTLEDGYEILSEEEAFNRFKNLQGFANKMFGYC